MQNWCWWEWWFKFELLKDRIKKLPFFDINKIESLYKDIEKKCCYPHDIRFEIWWNIFDFIKANYIFSKDLIWILQWTTIFWRFTIFLVSFILLNIFWIRYFNFK